MKVGILPVGQVAKEVLAAVAEGMPKTFPDTTATVITDVLAVSPSAFDKKRRQYSSSLLLNDVRAYAAKRKDDFHRILGVVDADMFSFGLNYVFGEAYSPGAVALISVWRLKPEFYRDQPNQALYLLRVKKEAIHELGHTLGVKHCSRSPCVMHFSNSIFDTDKKQNLLCDDCYLQAALAISNLG